MSSSLVQQSVCTGLSRARPSALATGEPPQRPRHAVASSTTAAHRLVAVSCDGLAVDLPQHRRVGAVPADRQRQPRAGPATRPMRLEVDAAPRRRDAAGEQPSIRRRGVAPRSGSRATSSEPTTVHRRPRRRRPTRRRVGGRGRRAPGAPRRRRVRRRRRRGQRRRGRRPRRAAAATAAATSGTASAAPRRRDRRGGRARRRRAGGVPVRCRGRRRRRAATHNAPLDRLDESLLGQVEPARHVGPGDPAADHGVVGWQSRRQRRRASSRVGQADGDRRPMTDRQRPRRRRAGRCPRSARRRRAGSSPGRRG